MASVQEYCKKLTTEQLRSVLAEYENGDTAWAQIVVQAVLAALAERGELE